MRKFVTIFILLLFFLSCSEKQNDRHFEYYDNALKIILSNPNPLKLSVWSDTTCDSVPNITYTDSTMQAAIYPNVVYLGSNRAANYNFSRVKACNEFKKPLYPVSKDSQLSTEDWDTQKMSIDYSKGCTPVNKLSSEWKKSWRDKFASDSITVSNARWAIYFSPPCKKSITAAVERHWKNGIGDYDFYYYFQFDDKNDVKWVSVSWIQGISIKPPLKGWNY